MKFEVIKVLKLLGSMSVAAILLGSGCANPINAHTAQNYYEAGMRAERSGDLATARMCLSRAHGNAILGNLGPAAEASYLYEYARLSGYTGAKNEADKAFLETLSLVKLAKGEADGLLAPTLVEYARFLHDTAQHTRAAPIFGEAMSALMKTDIGSKDPLGYAEFLDDYVNTLSIVGSGDRAAEVKAISEQLKAANPNSAPIFKAKRYNSTISSP